MNKKSGTTKPKTNTDHHKKIPTKWWKNSWLFIAVVTILIALIAVVFWTINNSGQAEPELTLEETRQSRVEEINNLLGREEYAQAMAIIEEEIAATTNDEELAELYVLRAVIYGAQGDYETALEVALEADSTHSSYRTVALVVDMAQVLEDNELLLQYLPKQIELLDREDPLYDFTKAELEDMLEELQ